MKWFVMVFFLSYNSDGTRDTFIFTNPTYDDRETCMATLTDNNEISKYVEGMMIAYNGVIPGPVEKVNCIDENQFNELQKLRNKQEGKHDT